MVKFICAFEIDTGEYSLGLRIGRALQNQRKLKLFCAIKIVLDFTLTL